MSKERKPRQKTVPKAAGVIQKQSAASGDDKTLVVYIHGIGPQAAPPIWKSQWDMALFGKDMGDQTRGAYWADILHEIPAIGARTLSVDEKIDVDQWLEEAGVDPRNENAQELAHGLVDSIEAQQFPTFERRMARQSFFDDVRQPIVNGLMRWLVKDTAAYFFKPDVREEIKQRLISQIPKDGEPFILVAHSQGTIISFDVLSKDLAKGRAELALFATLGSPLGLPDVIRDMKKELKLDTQVPPGVRTWHNFADRLDPVALVSSLAGVYEPRDGVAVVDHRIINQRVRELRGINPHDSAGYLSNPEVRQIVHRAARFDSTGRFVVARDVAEGFVTLERRDDELVERRHPVLIEVLEPHYPAVGEEREETSERERGQKESLSTMPGRIEQLAREVQKVVERHAANSAAKEVEAAEIQELRKYVAARLRRAEITELAERPAEYNVYAVWRSAHKRKLLYRSHGPLAADAARESYKADGRGITWAVLDTGCRWDHPHFNLPNGYETIIDVLDCTTKKSKPVSIKTKGHEANGDRDGHGTHVSGIIAGHGFDNKNKEYFGLAPKARLLVYKVLNDQGEGEDAWIIKAIDDIFHRNQNATNIQVHGVNLSLGGPFDATVYGCGFSVTCKELRDLWQQGVLVCVAAGNEGQIEVSTADGSFDLNTLLSVGDPANLEDCIAVGSVNADKPHLYGISWFSSRGPTADGRMKPDVVAPGERIMSCDSSFPATKKPAKPPKEPAKVSGKYREDYGTSMACPHVSGLLASFLSVRKEFIGRPDDVKRILLRNCNDLNRDRYHQGAGIPNLMKMLLDT